MEGVCCSDQKECHHGNKILKQNDGNDFIWWDGCKDGNGPCQYTAGVTRTTGECCCVDRHVTAGKNNSLSCYDSYCYEGGNDAYCGEHKFCPTNGSATDILCSCPGNEVLTTCFVGDTCYADGYCCDQNGECARGVYEDPDFPAKQAFRPCQFKDGYTSDGKFCECSKNHICTSEEFCYTPSEVEVSSWCLQHRICPSNDGTVFAKSGYGQCTCVKKSNLGTYCDADQYCHDGDCLDTPCR